MDHVFGGSPYCSRVLSLRASTLGSLSLTSVATYVEMEGRVAGAGEGGKGGKGGKGRDVATFLTMAMNCALSSLSSRSGLNLATSS